MYKRAGGKSWYTYGIPEYPLCCALAAQEDARM